MKKFFAIGLIAASLIFPVSQASAAKNKWGKWYTISTSDAGLYWVCEWKRNYYNNKGKITKSQYKGTWGFFYCPKP